MSLQLEERATSAGIHEMLLLRRSRLTSSDLELRERSNNTNMIVVFEPRAAAGRGLQPKSCSSRRSISGNFLCSLRHLVKDVGLLVVLIHSSTL